MTKLFVWDFHGVLEKGNEKSVGYVINKTLESNGYSVRLSPEKNHELYGLWWREYFERLLPGLPKQRYLDLESQSITLADSVFDTVVRKNISRSEHADEVLTEIVKKGHKQILISNTPPEILEMFIDSVDFHHHFKKDNTFGVDTRRTIATKAKVLTNYLLVERALYRNPDGIVIIGDTPTDIELKFVSGGIAYQFAHEGRPFRESKADYRIRDLREVLREI